MPAITVLMSVHNGLPYLRETLASVTNQSFEDYEFVIIDDASSDGSSDILAQAAREDARIRIIANAENQGLTNSLNRGLEQAQGQYIARIDSDDICLPDRLQIQFEHLEAHPEEVGVTSGYAMIDHAGHPYRTVAEPLDDWQIRWLLGWNPPAPHPTYFFRREPGGRDPIRYDTRFRTAQDYDLWARLSKLGPTRRLPDVLVQYRRHAAAITHAKRKEQAQSCSQIGRRWLDARLPRAVVEQLEPLIALFAYNRQCDSAIIAQAVAGAEAMLAHDLSTSEGKAHRSWVRQTTAGLLADAILSRAGGLGSPRHALSFAWQARRHLPYLLGAVAKDPGMALKSLRAAGDHSPHRPA